MSPFYLSSGRASSFVFALKSRLEGFMLLRAAQGFESTDDGSSAEALRLMKLWHGMEHKGLDTRLKAIRLFPYFFSTPPIGRQPKMVDPLAILDCLRTITETVDCFRMNPTAESLHRIWNDGGPTKLLLVLVTSHVSSFAKEDGKDGNIGSPGKGKLSQAPRSSWSGIAAAIELYMHNVLNITNGCEPIECRLLCRILLIIKEDISKTREDLSGNHGRLSQSIWFWKVFTAVLTLDLAKIQHKHIVMGVKTARSCVNSSCVEDVEGLYEWFRSCARAWSTVTETINWKDVKTVLAILAWPAVLLRDGKDHAADAWTSAIL